MIASNLELQIGATCKFATELLQYIGAVILLQHVVAGVSGIPLGAKD